MTHLACSLLPLLLALAACSGPNLEPAAAGEQQPQAACPNDGMVHAGCPIQRVHGCDDLPTHVLEPGQCLTIADPIWARIEDDIACFDLDPGDGRCFRECAGYLTIRNTGASSMVVAARSKLGAKDLKVLAADDARCQALSPGVVYAGGPTASSFPPAATNE